MNPTEKVLKNIFTGYCFLLVGLFFVSCSGSKKEPDAPAISKEEMKKRGEEMMRSMVAGEEHKYFQALVGTWAYKCTMVGSSGSASFYSASGKTTNRLVLDGRFLISESSKADSLTLPVGILLLGFDRGQQKYTTAVFSEGGTNFVTSAGTMAKATNIITTSGSNYNPILKIDELYDIKISILDENKYSIEILFKDKMARSTASGLRIDYLRDEAN